MKTSTNATTLALLPMLILLGRKPEVLKSEKNPEDILEVAENCDSDACIEVKNKVETENSSNSSSQKKSKKKAKKNSKDKKIVEPKGACVV